MFFDSHIHLNSKKIKNWENAKDWIFNNVSTNLEDLSIALEQAKAYKHIYVTAGIHPLEIEELEIEPTMNLLDDIISTNLEKIIAIGETGLDLYRGDISSLERQKSWFFAQYVIARKYNLPLVLHVRGAHKEMLELLSSIEWKGVIHCFEGTQEDLENYLSLKGNWMISVSPLVFREFSSFRNFLWKVPMEKLLIETDSPYLSSGYEKIFDLITLISTSKNISFDECKSILWENFYNFFSLKSLE